MKLRMTGGSLQIRLTKEEVALLPEGGTIEEELRVGPTDAETLRFSLEAQETGDPLRADLRGTHLRVVVSDSAATALRRGELESVEIGISVGGNEVTRIVVEKDRWG